MGSTQISQRNPQQRSGRLAHDLNGILSQRMKIVD
jgi:hypothetical protein